MNPDVTGDRREAAGPGHVSRTETETADAPDLDDPDADDLATVRLFGATFRVRADLGGADDLRATLRTVADHADRPGDVVDDMITAAAGLVVDSDRPLAVGREPWEVVVRDASPATLFDALTVLAGPAVAAAGDPALAPLATGGERGE